VRYNWPMSVHASQAFSIAHCTDSEDLLNKSVKCY